MVPEVAGPPGDIERHLAAAAAALEAGDAEAAGRAITSAVTILESGVRPVDPDRLLPIQARLLDLAEREAARLSHELTRLASSRRAAGAYRNP